MAQQQIDEQDDVIAQTEECAAWRSSEDGEYIYHLELGGITLHLLSDEWQELVTLMRNIS